MTHERAALRPRLLDLFCGAGGAAMGYYRAGFDVTGVDIEPQPHYPFELIVSDAYAYTYFFGHEYDAIHASPPCQGYSTITATANTKHNWSRDIPKIRSLLQAIGKPYVIENVPGAANELEMPLMLCGTMFDLLIERHRYFETSFGLWASPRSCRHWRKVVKHGRRPDRDKHFAAVTGHFSDVEFAQQAMGIDWMGQEDLREAIPPAYTEYIGRQLILAVRK